MSKITKCMKIINSTQNYVKTNYKFSKLFIEFGSYRQLDSFRKLYYKHYYSM